MQFEAGLVHWMKYPGNITIWWGDAGGSATLIWALSSFSSSSKSSPGILVIAEGVYSGEGGWYTGEGGTYGMLYWPHSPSGL